MEPIERTKFGQRLFDAREAANLTQEQAAKKVGMAQSTLAEAEISGKRSGYTPQLAELYGVSAKWLATGQGEIAATLLATPLQQSRATNPDVDSNVAPGPDIKGRVPLISWVQAGMWNEAVDIFEPGYADEWLPVLRNGSPHTYALRVDGDSMTAQYGKSYPEGTVIIVDPSQRSPSSGQRVIAKLAGSDKVTFKVFVEEDGRRWLKPLNSQHPPIHDEFNVIGIVTAKYEPE